MIAAYAIAAIFLWPVSIYRTLAAARRRRTGATALAVALWALTVMCTARTSEHLLDHIPISNLTWFIWHLFGLAGICAARIVVLASQPGQLNRDRVRNRIFGGALVALLFTVLFIVAPKQPGDYSPRADIGSGRSLVAITLSFNIYMVVGLIDIGLLTWRGSRTTNSPASRVGLTIASTGFATAALSGSIGIIRQVLLFVNININAATVWTSYMDVVGALSIGLGFLIPPTADLVRRQSRVRADHEPLHVLWSTLTAQIPDVVMDPPTVSSLLKRREMQILRYKIEIGDALNAVRLVDPDLEDQLLREPAPSRALGAILRDTGYWTVDPTGSDSIVALLVAEGHGVDVVAIAAGYRYAGTGGAIDEVVHTP